MMIAKVNLFLRLIIIFMFQDGEKNRRENRQMISFNWSECATSNYVKSIAGDHMAEF